MSVVKNLYGTNNQAITLTIASLVTAAWRQSTVVDNTTNLFLDALVQLLIKTGTGTVAAGYINIYAYGTADGGTTYSDGATGSDAAFTPTVPNNLKLIGTINCPTASTTYKSSPFSVAAAFGGVLPDHWGIIIDNESGSTLDVTAGNHKAVYQGLQASII